MARNLVLMFARSKESVYPCKVPSEMPEGEIKAAMISMKMTRCLIAVETKRLPLL